MNRRRTAVAAGLVAALGMLVHYGGAMFRARLSSGDLPQWAVYGSRGSSIVVYMYLVEIVTMLLIVATAVIAGYVLSRRIDPLGAYRSFVGGVVGGAAAGVFIVWLLIMREQLSSIGEVSPVASESRATEMLVMDIALPLLAFLTSLAEIGLVVIVGMIAGAALETIPRISGSPPTTKDADPNAGDASQQMPERERTEQQAKPA